VIRALLALLAAATPALGDRIERVSYEAVLAKPHVIVDFESFPTLPEPGRSIDGLMDFGSAVIGETLVGQAVATLGGGGTFWDAPGGAAAATAPLRPLPGPEGQNHAVAFHAGFGSNALFPLGPRGFGAIEGRGEGMAALYFPEDVAGFGVKLHADYADPLGTRPPPGTATFWFYDRAGQMLDALTVALRTGVQSEGFAMTHPGIAGVLISNTDPGGIAIDDILIPLEGLGS
jgi:hypothetical protein